MSVGAALLAHAGALGQRLETTGADVIGPQILARRDGLQAEVRIDAELPGAGRPTHATVIVRQRWVRPYADQPWEPCEYGYEIVDRERDFRRAFHLHDEDRFVADFRTVVHEHCEQPIGRINCQHYAGLPIRDGFEGIDRLLAIWTDDTTPDCSALSCLDG